jgi:hypothetical protein
VRQSYASLDAQAAAVQDAMEFLTRTLLRDEEQNDESLFTFKSVSVIEWERVETSGELDTSETPVGDAKPAHCSAAHSATVQLTALRRYSRGPHRGRCTAQCSPVHGSTLSGRATCAR